MAFSARTSSQLVSAALHSPQVPVLLFPVAVILSVWAVLHHGSLATEAAALAALGYFAFSRPRGVALAVVAASALVSALPHASQLILVAVALVLLVELIEVAQGAISPRSAHAVMLLLAGCLLASYAWPTMTLVTQVSRSTDVTGLIEGLALAAAFAAAPLSARRLTRVIALSGSVSAAYVLVRADRADGRLVGLGLNPNYLGVMMALPLVAALALAAHDRTPRWLAPAIPCAVALLTTESRTAFVAALAGLATILMSGRSLPVRALLTTGVLAAVALVPNSIAAVENGDAGNRSLAELTYNNTVRTHAAKLAVDVSLAHPLRGIGYGMFVPYAGSSPDLGVFMNTHDDYLRLAAEAGIPSLLLLAALVGWACVGRTTGHDAILRAVVVAYAVGLLFGNTLSNLAVSAGFWASLGTLLSQRTTTHAQDKHPAAEGDALCFQGPEEEKCVSRPQTTVTPRTGLRHPGT